MHTWIDIDKSNLLGNYRLFCDLAGKAKILPVLKSNAYGHGLTEVAEVLIGGGCQQFSVNYLFEAKVIRNLGFEGRIIVLGPVQGGDLDTASFLRCEVFLGGHDVLNSWLRLDAKPLAHIKFDTGMSRQGFFLEEAGELARRLSVFKNRVCGVCTHLADVEDVVDHDSAPMQLQRFDEVMRVFDSAGIEVEAHAASSASCLLLPHSQLSLCRIGISLYGLWPSSIIRLSFLNSRVGAGGDFDGLKPVLSWHSSIANIKLISKGKFIGYGCSFRALYDMKVAVIPLGYYEGYPRRAGESGAYVLIRGRRATIVGRICMNMMMVDVTFIDGISLADTVTLLGQQSLPPLPGKVSAGVAVEVRESGNTEVVSADDIGGWMQSINYEAVTQINALIPRRVISL